jgi:hypothetical protein
LSGASLKSNTGIWFLPLMHAKIQNLRNLPVKNGDK